MISTAHAETITGTFRYTDSGGVLRPIAFATVEIHRFAPRTLGVWAWGIDATVSTDSSGSISVPMQFVTNGVVYGVKVFATNYAAVVWPNDALHAVPFHREPGQPGRIINRTVSSRADVLDFSFDFTDSWSPQHYNLAETIRHGFDYANPRRDVNENDAIPVANVQPTSVSGSWYNPVVDTVVINSGQVFEDFLILHEYAHFLEEQISSFGWIASLHDGCIARDAFGNIINSTEHAWMEGFANYFAQSVGRLLPTGTLSGTIGVGTMSTATLENQPSPCLGLPASFTPETIENRVAGTLWDLFDPVGNPGSGEAHDTIVGRDVEIFHIFDRELDTYGTPPTICHFHNAWVARGFNHAALDSILARHGITSCEPPSPPTPTTCASFTYSGWGECQPDNTQTRTVLTSSPAGCAGGTPVTTQTCPDPPLVGEGDKCYDHYNRANYGLYPYIGTCPTGTECKNRPPSCHQECFLWVFCKTVCSGDQIATTKDMFCLP